jgi:hypothetical protein
MSRFARAASYPSRPKKNGSLEKLGGTGWPLEIDETVIGGKPKNMHTKQTPK